MKQETNKEMELMLRRLARRGDVRVPENNGNVISGQHLDADEMNAYAEHALPAAARARYTEHLADCVRCRDIMVGLSASLGRPVVEKVKIPEQRSSLKNFLATLFSPRFARYAIPTLALVGIVGIAVVVFRQGTATKEVARSVALKESNTQLAQTNQPPANDYSYSVNKPEGRIKADSAPAANTVDSVNKDAEPAKAGKPETVTVTDAPPPPVAEPKPAKLAAAEGEAGRREADADQKRPATVERQEQQPADEVSRGRDKENAKKEADDRATTEFRPAKSTVARARDDSNKNEVAKSRSAPAPTAGAGTFGVAAEEKKKGAKEVRTVAGRRFEREGNAWVDTAYESGRDTTGVARGSEQYRALIADEPEIRTIAETLSGEVVVVWKGRAYRIR